MPDLTGLEYRILAFIFNYPRHSCPIASIKRVFGDEIADLELDRLWTLGLICVSKHAPFDGFLLNHALEYGLTASGLLALQARNNRAQDQRNQESQRKIHALADTLKANQDRHKTFKDNLLVSLFGVIATAFVEHGAHIIGLVGKLFDWLRSLLH